MAIIVAVISINITKQMYCILLKNVYQKCDKRGELKDKRNETVE